MPALLQAMPGCPSDSSTNELVKCPTDPWAEGDSVHRMSTKIPGLGNETGLIDLKCDAMRAAAERDAEIADFVERAEYFWPSWLQEYEDAGDDLFARGCGW